MVKKCQVRPLGDCALAELANTVVTGLGFSMQTELDITVTMVEINSYLEATGATHDIYTDLLRVTLGSDCLDASIRFTCLQMLLNGTVQSLITEVFPYAYYGRILQVIAAQGSGLRTLNMKGVWVKEEHMPFMTDVIEKCTQLTRLSIPYIANDDLLKSVGMFSKNLRYLDVSGEVDVTDIGIHELCLGVARDWLTVCDIGTLGEENICHTDVAFLLSNMPNLENLVTYSFVGKSLLYIYEQNPEFRCKLRNLHDTKTDAKTMQAIIALCPQLESIYLDKPDAGIMHAMRKMQLVRLKVYKFSCEELELLLAEIGRNIRHLTVIRGRGIFDVGKLAKHCPSLIDLDCYLMEKLTYIVDAQFRNIQGLELLHSPFSEICLKHLICHSTSLKRLAIDTTHFNDEDLAQIFLEHDFNQLEDVWFTSAPNLTMQTVEILMERCPELQSIGQMSGWALTPDDLSLLRTLIKSGNSNLVLSPTSLFP